MIDCPVKCLQMKFIDLFVNFPFQTNMSDFKKLIDEVHAYYISLTLVQPWE